jgi:parallel beta-helix repeat protein
VVRGNVGDGIRCYGSSPSVTDSTISENSGYGIYCQESFAVIRHCTVSGSSESGICCSNNSFPSIMNNTVLGNRQYGIRSYNSSPVIANNTIAGNSWEGIRCSNSSPLIRGNTVSGNSGEGICLDASTSSVTNNIVSFNINGIQVMEGGTAALNNNCVYNPGHLNYSGLSAGVGDFSQDPLFVSRATGDYHLQLLSPCVDAGLNSAVQPDYLDIDGDPRVLPVGGMVDVGADEFTCGVSDAKTLAPNGRWVCLNVRNPMVTTAKFAAQQAYYVESPDRSNGIRCSGASLLDLGQSAVLQGVIATVDGERVLTQACVVGVSGSASVPQPLFLTNHSVGGGPNGLQCGVIMGRGLNNIGVLVRTFGRIVEIEQTTPPAAPTWFTIDDGSGVNVKCAVPSGVNIDPNWVHVTVTGISSCEEHTDGLRPLIRVRDAEDIVVVQSGT